MQTSLVVCLCVIPTNMVVLLEWGWVTVGRMWVDEVLIIYGKTKSHSVVVTIMLCCYMFVLCIAAVWYYLSERCISQHLLHGQLLSQLYICDACLPGLCNNITPYTNDFLSCSFPKCLYVVICMHEYLYGMYIHFMAFWLCYNMEECSFFSVVVYTLWFCY